MITYGSTTLTSYNTITKIEVYYYKSTSATNLAGGSWSTTKPTWENGKYIWQKIKTTYEGKLENGQFYSESDPVNITGQQGATGTAAYSYKLNASDSVIGKTKTGEYTIDKVTFTATYKQGSGAVTAYTGRFKIETTANGTTWTTQYTSSGNESSKEYTIPEDIISIRCSLYQSGGTSTLLDIVTIPIVKDGIDAVGLRDSISYYLASDKQTGVTRLDQGWTRFKPELTTEKRYLWVYYVSRYSEGDTQPELIEIKNDIVSFENHGDESPVENCVIDIEPVQDLHGYDSPWPAGGGENKLDLSMAHFNSCTLVNASTGTVKANIQNSYYGCVTIDSGFFFESLKKEILNGNPITFEVDNNYGYIISIVAFGTRSTGQTYQEAGAGNSNITTIIPSDFTSVTKVEFRFLRSNTAYTDIDTVITGLRVSYGDTATTFSPCSNICPITSFAGENIWDEEWEVGLITITNGQNVDGVGIRSKNFCKCIPDTTYHFEIPYNHTRYVFWYNSDQNYIGNNSISGSGNIISPSNAGYFKIRIDITTYNNDIAIKYPATLTDYVPYSGKGGMTAHVTRTGKNLLDITEWMRRNNYQNYTVDSDGWVTIPDLSIARVYLSPYRFNQLITGSVAILIDPDRTTATNLRVRLYRDGIFINENTSYLDNRQFNAVGLNYSNGGQATFKLMINLGATHSDWEPYTGNTYSITFPTEAGTVYGGTLDVTKGELVVDRAIVDLGTLTWYKSTSVWRTFYSTGIRDAVKKINGDINVNNFSSVYKTRTKDITSSGDNYIYTTTIGEIALKDTSKANLTGSDFKTAMNGIQFCYPLATPTIYNLTPQEITMLTGQNHIFSDTGQTAISYYDNQTSTDPYVDYSATSAFEVAQSVSDAVGTLQAPYKEVEWVESTGKQYVYLDWKPPIKTWGFEIDFISKNATGSSAGAWNETTNVNGYGTIFGIRSASGVNNVQLSSYNNGLLRVGNSTNIATGFKTDHTRQTIKLHNNIITKTDGTTATITRVNEDSSKNYCNMTIFALYTDALRRRSTCSINEPSSTRIYSLKFYDGDTLTVDLAGAIRKADKVTGLYDKVSKHFYPAPGMLYGNDVGDIIIDDTITENLNKTDVKATVINKNRSRMWEANVPFSKLEDGQKITVTYSYGGIVGSVETTELVGWDDTSSNYDVYLKLVFPNGDKTEWIPCYYSSTSRLTTHYSAGTPITFTYHENLLQNATETSGGSAVVRGFFANASYYSNTSYTQYSNNVKAGTNGIKYSTLIMQDGENTWSCFYSGAYKGSSTGKPAYTGGFRLGKVLYSSGSGAQTSNSSLDTYYNYKEGTITSTIYDAYPLDLRYSTNCATTLVAQRPVYLVGTVESDGLFHLDIGQWWTQTIPTYEDGKVYVYLGVAYSTYQLWLATENPAYVYYNNEFILYDKALTLQNIATLKDSLETQIDGKVETWCQKTNPASNWTAEERPNHTGDLWYFIGESDNTYKNNTTYQYNGSTNTWSAYSANPDLFDKIDGKTAIYYGTQSSVTSAEEGDYLVDSTDGSSYRWNNGAWVKVTDYKTAINNIQIGGRNLLCNSNQSLTTVSSKGDFYLSETIPTGTTVIASVQIDADNIVWETTDRCRIGFEMSQYSDGIATGTQYVGVWWGKSGTTNNGADINYNTSSTGATSYHGRIWSKVTLTRPFLADIKRGGIYVQGIASGTYKISNPKVEIATKPSDWTPAPEDVEEEISNLHTDLQSQIDEKIQTYYQSTNPASSWTTTELRTPHDGDLWYYTGTTTSTYIKDNVYRYNASNNTWSVYSASGELFDKVDGKSTIYYGTTSGTYTGVETGDYLVDSTDGSSYRWDGSKWVKVTDYKTTITNAIDDIEIGGRNLLIKKELGIYAGGNITYDTNKISATETGVSANGLTVNSQIPGWKISGLTGNVNIIVHGITNLPSKAVVLYYTCWNGTTRTKAQTNFSQQSVNSDGSFEYKATLEIPSESTHIALGFGQLSASTYELSSLKLEKGNKATDWTPAPEDTTASIKAYVDTLQFQVDHMAEIYYGTAVPTLSNTPASDWTTNDIKDIHIDDLYYNTSTGYCYRFMKSGSTYSWSRIKDSDITAAATAASNANTAAGNAQTTANNANTLAGQKRRIFVAQPTPPYEIGDLWVEGSNGDIKKCKTARATGSYTASDWELASKYTDDTVANTANTKIDNLKKVRLGWKVNYSSFTSVQNGECYFHGYDSNNAPTDANGIVEWNGADLIITKGMWINPNTIAPYNIPILHVFRTNTSPYHADVWWDDTLRKWRGYMYTSNQLPATVVDWAWNETNDCILATYISPSNEGVITSGQLFNPPKKFSEINDPSDLYNELTTINDAIISRGEQLVINGNGMMGSNYNFSSLTFDGSKSNGSPGSFTRPAETISRTIYSDEFFPVTPSNTYVLSFDLMSLNNLSTMYAFINFYDVDKKQIDAEMHMYCPNTLTTLSQDLKNGDTVVHLTDASNWKTTGSYNHGLIFWNYVNSFGYQYPEHTYSRNKWDKLFDLSNIDKTNNTITLNEAWNHGTFPTGTKLSQKNAGSTFKYLGITGSVVPNTWTSYKGRIGDIDYSGNNMMGMFPPGTAYAKVGFLWNYNKANDQIWVTNISVKEDVTRGTGFYAITTAPTAYTTQVGNFTPAYRIALSTVKTQSGLEEIMVGDVIQQGYNTYPVGYVDTSYVYLGSANSIRGATGATGLNNAQVILYRRFASAPSGTNVAPTGDVTYTFSTGKATNNLNSWTQNIPSGSDPVYMIAASASSTSSTDTIPKTEWSAPVKILENGQDGGTGSAGADGYNQATIFLYQRKSGTAPSKPSSAVTYTFSSGALSSTPTGWSRTIPTNDGNPCYVTTATAVAKTATYSIPANGWSDVVILSQDGEDGTSITITSTSVKYQKGTSGTTAPTGTWGTSIPSVGENEFLWTQTIVNYSDNSKTESYSVSRNAKNGTNGTSPTVSSTTVEYQQSTGGTTPPTGTWNTTAPTATAGQYMWTRTTVTYSDSKTAVSYSVSKNGTNGTSPTAYRLIVSHGAINKSQAGVYNPTTITLTSKYQTGNGALNNYSGRFKIETTTNNNTWTQDSASSTANESSKTYTIPANIKAVRFSLYLAGGFTTLLDQQTVPVVTDGAKGDNGEDAYTIVLTNEAHTFPAGVSAALAGSATSNVMTYKGGVQVACFVGSTSSATSISTGTTGLTCTINDNNSKNVSLTFTATTSLTTRAGTVTIPITVDNKAFSKTFTWSLANQGIKGEDGVSVTNVTSTNNTADGGTSVVTITLSNGTTKTFNVKNGSKGSQGDTGATAEWYYGTALTHISGSATLSPSSTSGAVVGSMYLNTKTSLVYKCTAVGTNNTWTYAGDLITGVIDNLQVGGKNLLLKEPRAFDPTTYNPYQLNLTEPLEANQPYTIQLWDVDVSNDKKTVSQLGVNVYYCGGSVTFGNWTGEQYFTNGHADHLTLTFTPTEANVTHSSVNNTTGAKYISLYNSVSNVDGSVKNLTIGKWQLEKGNVGTDWTLAPEDVENAIQNAQDKADEAWAATQPLAIKTYNDVTITNNNDPKGWLYFGTVKPTNYNTPWKIRYKVYASINGVTDSYQQSEVMIEGAKDTYYTYRTYNMISNTNYRPLYAYSLYTLKQAGVNNGYGHLIGIRFQSAYWPNSTYTNYKRTIKIEIIESTNCQITLADTMFLYADASGTGSTNYNTRYSFDGTTQGYTGSGDRNETNHILNNFSGKTGVLGIWSAGLFMRDGNGTYQNICTDSAGAISRTVNTTKKPNPNGFEIGSQIYYSPWNTYNANSNINGSVYASYGAFDSRYSLNTTLTTNCLTPYEPVYLVGTVRTDGLYYLDTVWWTQTPTDSSKTYVLIGGCYDSTTSYCRINLFEDNNWYKYVNGKLEDYTNRLAELAATTATAYITDTTNNGIMVHPENDTTSGWSIAGAIELFKTGISYIKLWIDNNIPKIRIGKEDSKHVLIDDDSVDIVDDEDVLASFGETARIGKENDSNVSIDNNGIIINKGSKELAKYFSKGIIFDEETPYKIGNDNSYITFEDTDSDNIADSLSIVADSIYFRDTVNTNIKDTLNSLQSDLAIAQEDIDLKNNYIKINTSEPSIVISASSNTNDTNLKLESSQLSFQIDGQTTATITNDQMNIPTASVTNLFMQSTNTSTNTVYEKVWVMRTNGHLSLKTITRN